MKAVRTLLKKAGFKDIHLDLKIPEKVPDSLRGQATLGVVPADIRATKPKEGG